MARFITINNERIRVDSIRSFRGTRGKLRVTYSNGDRDSLGMIDVPAFEELMGYHHIAQVIPCHVPLWQVWQTEGGYLAERVHFLALCANGRVKPLMPQNGRLDIDDSNCAPDGLFCEGELDRFEGLTCYDPYTERLPE